MHQGKPKVVLDTNIIISAGISTEGAPSEIFELLLNKEIINFTSSEIIDEIKDVMQRPAIKRCVGDKYMKFLLDNFKNISMIVKPAFDKKIVIKDRADDKFINCALSAKADIISGDKHLLELRQYKEVKVLGAKEFLGGL